MYLPMVHVQAMVRRKLVVHGLPSSPNTKNLARQVHVADTEPQTNQRGELRAILRAVDIIEKNFGFEVDVHIFTDSMYSKDCLTTWLPAWLANNWKTKQNKPVCHQDLIEYISTKRS